MPRNRLLLPGGLWPVMLTPFNADRSIDWPGLARLIAFYLAAGADGLFAVCGSSEMYALTPEERLALARFVVQQVPPNVPVVASGTFGGDMPAQAGQVREMADTGVRAVICIVNQLAEQEEGDQAWQEHVETLLHQTGTIPLGFYECPGPYHRLLSPALLAWAVTTERFFWLKDTSANLEQIKLKIDAARNSPLRFFNAHTGTLLASLQAGGDGFCGIAANFYPALMGWLCRNHERHPARAAELQAFLTNAQKVVNTKYLAAAKQFLVLRGVKMATACRVPAGTLTQDEHDTLVALRKTAREWHARLGMPF